MASVQYWSFGAFHLDASTACLWQDEQLLSLPPKPLAVLTYLVARAGQVVTKEELLDAVWPEAVVSEGVLKTCLAQIRRALGETAQAPEYIATVHRRGYRFMAPVTVRELSAPRPEAAADPVGDSQTGLVPPAPLVARQAEMAQLHQSWAQALQGTRQVVFVTGEAGIGKTSIVDAFVAQIATSGTVWLGRGQCIEQYGAGEAYLPLLEAFGQLGRGHDGARLIELLRQQAPSWLLQMPALLPATAYEVLQQHSSGTTRERMLRELAEAVETLTLERPLVLVLEDLHWSDYATIDWLAFVARRRTVARLLVLGTYRPADAVMRAHPVHTVMQELRRQERCTELVLRYLSEVGVVAYLAQRFEALEFPEGLAWVLHQHTNGNPFFLVTVVQELVRQGTLVQQDAGWIWRGDLEAVATCVPASIRHLIEHELVQVSPEEQDILAVASVAGVEFSAAAVAAGVEQDIEHVETHCDALARGGQFLVSRGIDEWPDGTVASRYRFIHDLYHEVLYDRIPTSRRGRWHRQIGARLEAGYGARAREMASELAMHFQRGRDVPRAVSYLQIAGAQATQRLAHQAALQHLTQALDLLATLPATAVHVQQEIALRIALGPALMAARGWAAPEVEQTYARARELCAQVGEIPQLFPALMGLSRFYLTRGPLPIAREFGQQLDRLAQDEDTLPHRLEAHKALGDTLFFMGEFTAARSHLAQGITLTDPTVERIQALRYGIAPGVRCLAVMANTLWCLGAPTQAVQRSQEALALAQEVAHPQSLAMVHHFAALLHYRLREVRAVQAQAKALLELATAQGFPLYVGHGTCWQGWALAVQGQEEAGTAQLRQGLAAVLATGQTMTRPFHLVLLAEAAGHAGQVEVGLRLLAEALTAFETSGRADMLAEVYRLQGEFLLQQAIADPTQAEACFQQALAIARCQQAKSWELRAAMSLSRLWQQQGKPAEAQQLLAKVYTWFTEGFDTVDLREARALLPHA